MSQKKGAKGKRKGNPDAFSGNNKRNIDPVAEQHKLNKILRLRRQRINDKTL